MLFEDLDSQSDGLWVAERGGSCYIADNSKEILIAAMQAMIRSMLTPHTNEVYILGYVVRQKAFCKEILITAIQRMVPSMVTPDTMKRKASISAHQGLSSSR